MQLTWGLLLRRAKGTLSRWLKNIAVQLTFTHPFFFWYLCDLTEKMLRIATSAASAAAKINLHGCRVPRLQSSASKLHDARRYFSQQSSIKCFLVDPRQLFDAGDLNWSEHSVSVRSVRNLIAAQHVEHSLRFTDET